MAKYAYHQIDGNQREIMDYFQAHGFSWVSIGRPLDALVGKYSHTYLIEVKRRVSTGISGNSGQAHD